ncbi:MAG: PIN domain-containing protein [Clostridiaceae bacterium]|nr:PIN domain-containing protein [Clostridiaceae bacterium]
MNNIVSIADVRSSDIEKALISEIDDVEDALLVEVAVRFKADLILTRNTKDFVKSSIKAMTPSQFLSL